MDWMEQASALNQQWLEAQQKLIKEFVNAGTQKSEPNPAKTPLSMFTDTGKKLAKQYVQLLTPVKPKTIDDYVGDANKMLQDNYQEAWFKSQEIWRKFGLGSEEKADQGEAPEGTLQDLFGPQGWWKQLFSPELFDGKLSDLPSFAGVTSFDKKMALAVDEWQALQNQISNYAFIVMNTWLAANAQFQSEIEGAAASSDNSQGWNDLLASWQKTSDKALMEMYRSDDFLKAQKSLMEASAAYRMAEQSIAEEAGKALHLPTRSEVDELHKKVYTLNKEIRILKKELESLKAGSEKPKTATRRKTASRKSTTK